MSDRFFLDHGAIHDSVTGQHVAMVHTEEDWQVRLLLLLNELDHKGRELDIEVQRLSRFIRRIANEDNPVIESGNAVIDAYDTGALSHKHIDDFHDALAIWTDRASALEKSETKFCSIHSAYYSPGVNGNGCPMCAIRVELSAQSPPRAYEVARALSVLDASESRPVEHRAQYPRVEKESDNGA